jgi:hypothetical protein
MATVKGVNQTLIDAGGEATIGGGLIKVRRKVIKDSYVIGGSSETAGTIIKLFGAIPAGAILQSITLDVSAAQAGGSTIDVGDLDSATRYASADTQLETALGTKTFTRGTYSLGQRVVGTSTYDNQIILTVHTATMTAATLYAELCYTDPVE